MYALSSPVCRSQKSVQCHKTQYIQKNHMLITQAWVHACTHMYRERERITRTPSMVLEINKYRKFPRNSAAMLELMWDRSMLWIAWKSTTDVASFTTPSPKTRLYNKGVSSWLRTCNNTNWSTQITFSVWVASKVVIRPYLHQESHTCKVQTESVAENIAPIAAIKARDEHTQASYLMAETESWKLQK
jgi:hypothetical protein